ncbi:DUF4422 domain-containing protein [Paucilactobacillus nenjiangensis]|uniref:DUF4422 domain-containing protein n=1 Tax=Paucilactobacillus nenjiangensis TaxID=1296540 RepID=UPI0028D5A5B0|nr:DUF4422 domain-containing protein [Paucilactobacillus nenjiangensis]
MNTKILVAAHKAYEMPKDKNLYLPIFVGKELRPNSTIDYTGDNSGQNISAKNPSFNELTAIYWAWKNLDADAIGLVHYRRYLSLSHKKSLDNILSQEQVDKLFEEANIILPKRRNYIIQTNQAHYVHAHHYEPLDRLKDIIMTEYPEYYPAYQKLMKQRSAHMFNMFIMKRKEFGEYCEWMFDILFELESKIDISDYDPYETRVFGFLSELMLDVWIETKRYSFVEVNFVHLEGQNWLVKGTEFIKRMFEKKRK